MSFLRNLIATSISFTNRHPELVTVGLLLLVSLLAHSVNMFHFPYYENDEAVYISQAWSITEQGTLAPYTYWYDHAPGGWMLIALWSQLTGGYFTFGNSIDTGRVLMLVLHLASTYFLYYLGKRLTGSRFAGIVSALIFSLSPLGIHFQRRVLLDNIMMFWALLSAVLLLASRHRLRFVFLSAIAFAIACLSKETAVFFFPAYLYLLWRVSHPQHRITTFLSWISLTGAVVSLYPLYALIKGEFFPAGTALGGTSAHVSLLETLKFQGSRPGGSIFDPPNSLFWQNMKRWNDHDLFLITGGVISVFALAFYWLRNRASLIGFSVLFSVFAFLFLMRGGVVIEFYVIPMVPLLALSLGISIDYFSRFISSRFPYVSEYPTLPLLRGTIIAALILGYLVFGNTYQGFNIYTADQTKPQHEALAWIRENAGADDYIVTDNYLWLDLNAPENPSGKVFKNAEWYWKVERDPEIKEGMFGGTPAKVDYVIQTPQVVIDTRTSDFKLIIKTLEESKPIVAYDNDNWSVIIWGHRTPDKVLKRAWTDYKQTNIEQSGRVIDRERPDTFTSQAQSYALMRAVWMGDKDTFDRVLDWTLANLQYENGTFRGVYNPSDTSLVSFSDADTDIAMALIFAYHTWWDGRYADEANHVLSGIWNQDVVLYKGTPYMSAGNWAEHATGVTLNPSYLSPAAYRVFAKFDESRPWTELTTSSYRVLNGCTSGAFGSDAGALPTDWCNLDTGSGAITVSKAPQPVSTDYSIDAFRVPWRIALDYQWYQSSDAKSYLSRLDFLSQEYRNKGLLYASYKHDGTPRDTYELTSLYAGSLGYFMVMDPDLAKEIYEKKILEQFYENADRAYWQAPDNYYTQNWAWFGTALYGGLLPNLSTR